MFYWFQLISLYHHDTNILIISAHLAFSLSLLIIIIDFIWHYNIELCRSIFLLNCLLKLVYSTPEYGSTDTELTVPFTCTFRIFNGNLTHNLHKTLIAALGKFSVHSGKEKWCFNSNSSSICVLVKCRKWINSWLLTYQNQQICNLLGNITFALT